MASNNSKVSIPVAVDSRTKVSLPSDHVTTGEFLTLQPILCNHIVKNSHIKNTYVGNIRPAPIALPTYGAVTGKIRHFFVPFRLLMPKYDAFYSATIDSDSVASGIPAGVPYFTSEDFNQMMVLPANGLTTIGSVGDYDFFISSQYYKLTTEGKRVYKIFYSLGYDWITPSKGFYWNAFSLLAFARVWCDWYANNQYLNYNPYLKIMQLFNYQDVNVSLHLTDVSLYQIFKCCLFVNYDSNGYFENAWDNILTPNTGLSLGVSVNDVDGVGSTVRFTANNLPLMEVGNNVEAGTDYLHKMLTRLSEYQLRNGLAGARSIDRMIATFGDGTRNLQLQKSVYLGYDNINVEIGDVVATATSTDGSNSSEVGDYSGIGFGKGSGNIDYDTDEDGVYIVMQSILPSGGYYQGYDRCNRHIEPFDFFHPETEVGMQSIERGEVYVSKNDPFYNTDALDLTDSFAFVGRYGEYKRSISRVSGDIALERIYNGGDAWHLMRKFNDVTFSGSIHNVRHTVGFASGLDSSPYNRIFQYTSIDRDHFFCFYHFNLEVTSPFHSLFETFDFENESKKVTLNTGTKIN